MEVNCTHDQRACMTVRFTSYIAAHDGVRRDEVYRKKCVTMQKDCSSYCRLRRRMSDRTAL